MEIESKPSLYDRLGGVYNIAVVVDDLIDRVMGDPRLNANPRVDEAHHRVSAQGFKSSGHGNGLLGRGGATALFRAVNGRCAPAPHDHER